MGQVQNTCEKLNARYVEYGVNFAEDSEHLTAFLEAHSHPSKRVVQVEGMDGDGNAVKHTFKLHELDAKKKEDPSGDVESCVSLATLFAKEVIGRLQYRMRSLKSLVGSKLFLPDAYPDGVNKRDRLCAEWFSSLRKMFNAEQCALPAACCLLLGDRAPPFSTLPPPRIPPRICSAPDFYSSWRPPSPSFLSLPLLPPWSFSLRLTAPRSTSPQSGSGAMPAAPPTRTSSRSSDPYAAGLLAAAVETEKIATTAQAAADAAPDNAAARDLARALAESLENARKRLIDYLAAPSPIITHVTLYGERPAADQWSFSRVSAFLLKAEVNLRSCPPTAAAAVTFPSRPPRAATTTAAAASLPKEWEQVWPKERGQVGPKERGQVGPKERGQVGPKEREQVGPTEWEQVWPKERGQVGPKERGQVGPKEREQVGPTEWEQVWPKERGQVGPKERGQVGPKERGQVGPKERGQEYKRHGKRTTDEEEDRDAEAFARQAGRRVDVTRTMLSALVARIRRNFWIVVEREEKEILEFEAEEVEMFVERLVDAHKQLTQWMLSGYERHGEREMGERLELMLDEIKAGEKTYERAREMLEADEFAVSTEFSIVVQRAMNTLGEMVARLKVELRDALQERVKSRQKGKAKVKEALKATGKASPAARVYQKRTGTAVAKVMPLGKVAQKAKEKGKKRQMDEGKERRMDEGKRKRVDEGKERQMDEGKERRVDEGKERRVDEGKERRMDEGKRKRVDEGKERQVDEGKERRVDEGKERRMDEGKRKRVDEGKERQMDEGKERRVDEGKERRVDEGKERRMDEGKRKRVDEGKERQMDEGKERRVDEGKERRVDEGKERRVDEGKERRVDEGKERQVDEGKERQMDEGKVDEGKVDEGKVDEGKVDEGKVDEGKVDEGKVDEGKVDEGKVDEGKVDEGKVDEGKVDEGKVDEGKVDEGKVDEGKVDEGKVDEGKVDEGKDKRQGKRTTDEEEDREQGGALAEARGSGVA
ncbi:unnamed protein product [Closterium sp. Naga37s-1]|nr:unnamed protein product [Closterium sp. Naga37s-1]